MSANENDTKTKGSRYLVWSLSLGVVAVVVAGVWGGIVGFTREGNPGDEATTTNSYSSADCALDGRVISKVGNSAVGELAAFSPMDRPYSLAEFRFVDGDGVPKTIADWRGRTILLNLWATWCAPCRAEMPSFDRLQKELGSEKFEVVPISVDKSAAAKPKAFFEEISISAMRFFHDKEAMTLNLLKREGLALGLPVTLLVDGRGCAIGRINGPAEWDSEDAKTLIRAAL